MIKYEEIYIPPTKSAKILEKWRVEENVSLTSLQRIVDYTYDVVYNVFTGKNKDTSLERAARISLALGHNLEEFCEQAFEGNEEMLSTLLPSRQKAKELEAALDEMKAQNSSIPQNEHHASLITDQFKIELFERFTKMQEEHEHRMEEEYKVQIAELKESAKAIEDYEKNKYDDMKQMYERIVKKQEEIIASQEKKIAKLAGALSAEAR